MKRERAKKKPSGRDRDRRKKKALSGPQKPANNQRAKRRGIVAARKRRRRGNSPGAVFVRWTRRADRSADRLLRAAEAPLLAASRDARRFRQRWARRLGRIGRPLYVRAGRTLRWCGRRLRPLAVLALRGLARLDRGARRAATGTARAATRASAALTPQRGISATIVASSGCLIAAQFVTYRGVEVGEPGYSGLPGFASAPLVAPQTPIDAHSIALIPVALLAAGLAILAARRRRPGLGRPIFLLGAACLAVVLLIDRPAGLDASAQAARFSGAEAVLSDGYYAQIAAAVGMMLGGALLVAAPKAAARYHARPCRTRTNLYARAASALRRRPRRRASSPAKGARSRSPRRSGAASAPASRP